MGLAAVSGAAPLAGGAPDDESHGWATGLAGATWMLVSSADARRYLAGLAARDAAGRCRASARSGAECGAKPPMPARPCVRECFELASQANESLPGLRDPQTAKERGASRARAAGAAGGCGRELRVRLHKQALVLDPQRF